MINNFYLFGESFYISLILSFGYKGENSNQVKFNNLQPGIHLEWEYCLYRITVSQSVSLLRGPEITEVQHGLFSPSTTWSPLSYYLTLRLPLSIVVLIVLFFIFLPLVLLFRPTIFIIMMLRFVFLGRKTHRTTVYNTIDGL